MNWTIFGSTFVLVFLAELGDKTQLAVMSQSGANAGFRLTIFAAGALALAASTALGVLAGAFLQRVMPDERYIKIAGGVLFLVFGLMMLREGIVPHGARTVRAAPRRAPEQTVLGRLVLRQAAAFERAALQDYHALAKRASSQMARELFVRIAAEEAGHSRLMGQMAEQTAAEATIQVAMPAEKDIVHDVAGHHAADNAASDRELLTYAIAHEEATAAFYRALAQSSALPTLRRAFTRAADDETRHATMMRELLNG